AIVEEGLMLALSAVRMAVKNRIIVGALREGEDYLELVYQAAATEELLALAREKDEDSRRMTSQLAERDEIVDRTDLMQRESLQLRRRDEVSRGLAARLRAVAGDEQVLGEVVESARDAAWHEISTSIRQLLARRAELEPGSPDYLADREARLRHLVRVDLAELSSRATPTY
ncbi:MAG: hypothetical protein ACRCY9_01020, partial [Phycicoccus sp.]